MAAIVQGRIQWPRQDEKRTQRVLILSFNCCVVLWSVARRLRLKCDGTSAETRFRLSASPFKSAEVSVQSTTGSRGGSISGSNVGYTMFRGSVKYTDYPLHSPVSPSPPLPPPPCATTFQLDSTSEKGSHVTNQDSSNSCTHAVVHKG
jgi:hypothetical protein